jgi:hypothetical protein
VYPESFRTGRLKRELQMIRLSATRCSCIAVLWAILVSFAAITLCVDSQRVVYCCCLFRYRLSPETFDTTSYVLPFGREVSMNVWYKQNKVLFPLALLVILHSYTFISSHNRTKQYRNCNIFNC